ncbi:MAG: response regulator, partial [Spirochaetia bacterium]|nr:response regulator [Spirochaetia bacterium]
MQNNSLDSINSALRFLIVEDNPDDAFLLIHHLRTSFPLGSFDVVANKEELSNRLSSPVSFDVVLSDWSLPRLDGLGVLAMVRKAGVDVPFILVSGKIGEEAAIRAIREGVYDYILKDSPQRLPSAIQHALIQYSQEKREKIQNDLITLQVAALQAAPVAIEIIDPQGNIEWINEAYHGLTGREGTEVLGRPASDFEAKNDSGWLELVLKKDIETAGSIVKGTGRKKNNSLYLEERRVCPVRNSKGSIIQFVIIRKDITSEEEEKKELELELFFSETNRETQDLENLCQRYISISQSISLDWALSIQLLTDGERRLERHFGIISNTVSDTPQLSLARREVLLHDEVLARLTLSYPANHVFDQKRLSLILFSHIESAIKELVSQAKIQSQIKKISFLKLISRTISTYMDFETVMRPLLDQIRTVLECDAVALFLVDKEDKTFVCRVKNGYRADFSIGTRVPLHDVIIGAAVEEGKIVSIHDFSAIKPDSKLGELIQREGFRSQHAVPIIVSGQMKGVLEVWFRKDGFIPPPEWLVLYDAIEIGR